MSKKSHGGARQRRTEAAADAANPQMCDLDFIEWRGRGSWTMSEAVHLIHGFLPRENLDLGALISRFPDVQEAVTDALAESVTPSTPFEWTQHFLNTCPEVVRREWEAIYPLAARKTLGAIFAKEPDYRQFVDDYFSNRRRSLLDICSYWLNVASEHLEHARGNERVELNDLLHILAAKVNLRVDRQSELLTMEAWTRECFDNYPPGFLPDNRCVEWIEWAKEHRVLTDALRTRPPESGPAGRGLSHDISTPGAPLLRESGVSARNREIAKHRRPNGLAKVILAILADKPAASRQDVENILRSSKKIGDTSIVITADDFIAWTHGGKTTKSPLTGLKDRVSRAKRILNL